MNNELSDYIAQSRNNKMSDEDIKSSLLAKGWNIKDVEESFFVLSGGDKSVLKNSLQEQSLSKRNAVFASISLGVPILIVIPFFFGFIPALLAILVSFIALILGIIGVKSNRRVQASFGIFLNSTYLLLMLLLFGLYFYMYSTGKDIFTGKELTPQERIDYGLDAK